MSVEDVDRELRMQERLDILIRVLQVENGEVGFELGHGVNGGPKGHDWYVAVITMAEYDSYGESTSWADERTTRFTGVTLVDAVALAWTHYGAPVICSTCDGEGEAGERAIEYERATCLDCKGDGCTLTAEATS